MAEEIRKRTVAVYARVSTEHEAQLSALDNQVQYYDDIMKKHPEWMLYASYVDEGITGTSTKKRKNFMKMMADAEDHKFDLIITREVSRFARNTVDTLQETRKLKKMGVEVWFTEDNIWTMNDEDGELRLTIMATLAQNESKKTSLRVKAGQMVSFHNAVPYGNGSILGYDRVETKVNGTKRVSFEINPEQARVVRLIFDMYLAGKGVKKIQYELEQRGERTATGLTRWDGANISRILRNEFYAGIIVYRKQYVPDYLEQKKVNNFGEVPMIRVRGSHEPIVTEEEFQRCKEIRDSKSFSVDNRGKRGIQQAIDIWTKKLECSCGSTMNRRRWRVVNGIPQYCYQCRKQLKTGSYTTRVNHGLDVTDCCRVKMVPRWKLTAIAECIFRESWSDKKRIIQVADELLEEYYVSPQREELAKQLKEKEKEKERLTRNLKNLVDLRINEAIDMDTYNEKRQILLARSDIIDDDIEALKKIMGVPGQAVEDKLIVLKHALAKLANSSLEMPDEVIDALVNKVIVYEDYMEWHLNIKPDLVYSELEGSERRHSVTLEDTSPSSGVSFTGCYCQRRKIMTKAMKPCYIWGELC